MPGIAARAAGLLLGSTLVLGCETTPKPPVEAAHKARPPEPLAPKALGREIRRADALMAQGRGEEIFSDRCGGSEATSIPRCVFLRTYTMPDRNQAWKQFNTWSKRDLKSALAPLGMQLIYVEWNIDDQALQAYERAIASDSRLAIAHSRMGAAFVRSGDDDRARVLFEKALREDPEDADALLGLARLHAKVGDVEQAMKRYQAASAAWPESEVPDLEAAAMAEKRGEPDRARVFYREAADRAPRSVDIRRTLAALLVRAEDNAEARAVYEEAVEIEPGHFPTLVALAQLATQMNDTEGAFEYFRRAAEAKQDDLEVQRAVGKGFLARDQLAGAEHAFNQVIMLAPEDPDAHLALAHINQEAGRLSDAVSHYRATLKARPDQEVAGERAKLERELSISATPARGKTVNATFNSTLRVIDKFYRTRVKERPELGGEVTLEVTIDPDGRVRKIRITRDTLKDEPLSACIYWNVMDAVFPKSAKTSHYTYPMTFSK